MRCMTCSGELYGIATTLDENDIELFEEEKEV